MTCHSTQLAPGREGRVAEASATKQRPCSSHEAAVESAPREREAVVKVELRREPDPMRATRLAALLFEDAVAEDR